MAAALAGRVLGAMPVLGDMAPVKRVNPDLPLHDGVRQDDFSDSATGVGTSNTISFTSDDLDNDTITELVRGNWLASRAVKLRPDEVLAKDFEVEENEEAKAKFDALNFAGRYPEGVVQQVLYSANAYGAAACMVGAKSGAGSTEQPLGDTITEVAFLECLTAAEVEPVKDAVIDDPESPNHGLPEVWEIVGDHPRAGLKVHHTRLFWVIGEPATGVNKNTDAKHFGLWGESILQAPYAEIKRYGMTWQSVGHLMKETSMVVMSMHGLIAGLAEENEDDFKARATLMNATKALSRMWLLDAEKQEKLERLNVDWSGYPGLLQEISLAVAGALNTPVTKLFGRSPAGMNATGESDITNWYDSCVQYRTKRVQPLLKQIFAWLGTADAKFVWPPFWQPSLKEQAEARNLILAGDKILADLDVDPLAIAKARSDAGFETLDLGLTPEAFTFAEPVDDTSNPEDVAAAELAARTGVAGGVVELTPSQLGSTVTLNEARAQRNLGVWPNPEEGKLTITEWEAVLKARGESAGKVEGTTDAAKEAGVNPNAIDPTNPEAAAKAAATAPGAAGSAA